MLFFPHERQEGSIKRRISFYGFIILELNLAFIWQYYPWLMWPPWNAGYFKSLGMSALGPTIASSFLLFHFLQILLDLLKNNQGSWAPRLKEVRLGQKATEQRFAIIIKKIPLTARRNRPFLIIQRSEGLPTSDAAQVRHWYVFCVLLYPFWMRILYKALSRPHLWEYKLLRTVWVEAVWGEPGEAHCLEEVGRCLAALPLDSGSTEFIMPNWRLTTLAWCHQVHQTSSSEVTTQLNEWASLVSSITATFASANHAAVEIPSPGLGSHPSFLLRVLISLSVSRFPPCLSSKHLPLRSPEPRRRKKEQHEFLVSLDKQKNPISKQNKNPRAGHVAYW